MKNIKKLTTLNINNVHLYNYIIIHASDCDLWITNSFEEIHLHKGYVYLLERNLFFNVRFERVGEEGGYNIYRINNDVLRKLKKIQELIFNSSSDFFLHKRSLKDKVFKIHLSNAELEIFFSLINQDGGSESVYKLSYLLSKINNHDELFRSLSINMTESFSDKVRAIVSEDMRKKWRLSDVACRFNMSDITVRKKLESESTSFQKLLLDTKMNKAFHLLVYENMSISYVSNYIGLSGNSYFIKVFKNYYNVTPKQLLVNLRSIKH
ncbi:helix-turn-helix domain-containing protein [Escherichia coli]